LKARKPLPESEEVWQDAPTEGYDFSALFEQYQAALVRYLANLVNDIETAHDLTQETFIRSYQFWLERGDTPEAVNWRPFLYKIATNCAFDFLKRRKKIRFSSLFRFNQTETPEEKTTYEIDIPQDPIGSSSKRRCGV
jgi:DNA-directed RNA polymerase specialized sigma24 family protein